MTGRLILMLTLAAGAAVHGVEASAAGTSGEQVYDTRCAPCHKAGLMGAPKTGDEASWEPRLRKGTTVLLDHALNGFGNLMPPRGGSPSLSDQEVRDALAHMLASVGVSLDDPALAKPQGDTGGGAATESAAASPAPEAAGASASAAPAEEPAKAAAATTASAAAATAAVQTASPPPPAPAPAASPSAAPAAKKVAARQRPTNVNAFNRLMKPPSERNPPPAEDGIHDTANQGTHVLQTPRESFADLPKSKSGNRVDWVAALDKGLIAPRFDLVDPDKQPVVMDLNIVREVKGSMPDVVYPHKQHTEWLDCSNCHPAIFKPQKGANQMSMANILLGKQCGVCHGKVAFPVGECRKCHSRKKPKTTTAK